MKEFAITKQLAYHVWPFIQLKTLFPILPPTFLTVHFFDWIKCLSKHLCWYSHFMYKLRCYRYFDCKYRNCIFFQSWKYDCIYCNATYSERYRQKYNYKKAYEATKFSCRLFPFSEALLNNNQFRVSTCIFLQRMWIVGVKNGSEQHMFLSTIFQHVCMCNREVSRM